MNCYLPWNLKDMTNISAEKLQKNIGQQISYIELYRSELIKESLRFNIASLLLHVALNRSSLDVDDFAKTATDCLTVFLHSASFLKKSYFAPTDAENPAVGKCARNLHRLMMENVKATMKYIDYSILLRAAEGEIGPDDIYPERQRIHNEVFPTAQSPSVETIGAIGDELSALIRMETSEAKVFSDFDVQKTSALPADICQKLSAVPRRDDDLPTSEFGIIGACRQYLDTPFIRYGNTYYSFVVPFCVSTIAEAALGFVPPVSEPKPEFSEEPVTESEPEPEEPVIEEEPVVEAEPEQEEEPVVETEPETEPEQEPEVEEEQTIEAEPEPEVEEEPETEVIEEQPEEESVVESEPEPEPEAVEEPVVQPEQEEEETEKPDPSNDPFDEDDEIETPEEEEGSLPNDNQAYTETDEFEFPDEFEEDKSDSDLEEEDTDKGVYGDPDDDSQDHQSMKEPEPVYDEEPYTALVSPDAYGYLEEAAKTEFQSDPMLDEQESFDEELEEYDQQDEQPVEEEEEEEDPYAGESLFSILDEDPDEQATETHEVHVHDDGPRDQEPSFPADEEESFEPEDEIPFSEPEPEPEPVHEPEPEPEPVPEPVPEPEPPKADKLPLLEQILSYSPSRNNPITQYLNGCTPEQQKEIVRFIELARKNWLIDGKDKMFSIPDTNISVALFSQTQDPMVGLQRHQNIGAVMYASQKDSWNSLELSYDTSGQLAKAEFVRISKSTFNDWEWKIVEKLGARIIERRSK